MSKNTNILSMNPWPEARDGRHTAPFKIVPPFCHLIFAYSINIGIDCYEEALYIKKDYRHFDVYSVTALDLPKDCLNDPDRTLLRLAGLQLLCGHTMRRERTGPETDQTIQEMFETLIEARLPHEFPQHFIQSGSLKEQIFWESLERIKKNQREKTLF